jgi:hypothetical protein
MGGDPKRSSYPNSEEENVNFDQFATSFKNSEINTRCGEYNVEKQEGEVVLAGTMVVTTPDSCCIDINGAQYEIASSDVIDIQTISAPESLNVEKVETTDAVEPTPDDVRTMQSPETVLVKVNKGAILTCRIPVPAVLLSAVGTWMQVVVPAAKAA